MAGLTPTQRAWRARVERVIRVMAPALDALLFVGDRVSRVAGRNELPPEPARHEVGRGDTRTPLGGPPTGA